MTTAETQTIAVTVTEASVASRGSGDVWQMKLKVPWSQYGIPVSMPRRWAEEVKVNDSLMVTLRKGRLRKPEYDGTREYHYFWEIDEWGATAPMTPPQAAPAAAVTHDDRFRTKEELRWTEALRIAAGWFAAPGDELMAAAQTVYGILRDDVPDAIIDKPIEPPYGEQTLTPGEDLRDNGPPPARGQCEAHGRAWAQTPAGRPGHPLGNGEWCYQEAAA